jgi:NAD-dependent SIR2 family protein deacetylase
MMLGDAATARVRLIVWCKDCGHQVEPDPAEQAQRYGAELPVLQVPRCRECGTVLIRTPSLSK